MAAGRHGQQCALHDSSTGSRDPGCACLSLLRPLRPHTRLTLSARLLPSRRLLPDCCLRLQCKTQVCQTFLQHHVARKRYKAGVWLMGHSSSDPTVDLHPGAVRKHKVRKQGCYYARRVAQFCSIIWPRLSCRTHRCSCCTKDLAQLFCFLVVGWWRFACTCQQACHRCSPAAAVPALFQRPGSGCRSLMLLLLLQFAFLHVKGRSGLKHTRQLLECWRERPDLPTLTVVGRFSWNEVKDSVKARNMVLYPKVCGPLLCGTVAAAHIQHCAYA